VEQEKVLTCVKGLRDFFWPED